MAAEKGKDWRRAANASVGKGKLLVPLQGWSFRLTVSAAASKNPAGVPMKEVGLGYSVLLVVSYSLNLLFQLEKENSCAEVEEEHYLQLQQLQLLRGSIRDA